jgi:hypothetical protein
MMGAAERSPRYPMMPHMNGLLCSHYARDQTSELSS